MAQQSLLGQGLLIVDETWSHSDTPHSGGRLWTSDQPDAETSTWQHTTLTRDRHPCPGGIWTHNPRKLAAADPCLRPRGHWDRHWLQILILILIYLLTVIGLSPGGSTHLHTNNTYNNTNNNRTTQITTNVEECGPCPVFASFTLAFALQLRETHGKTSVRVRKPPVIPSQTNTLQNPYYN